MTNIMTIESVTHKVVFEMLDEDTVIQPSDFHSMDLGRTLSTIKNVETIGQRPHNFSPDRSFWRVISIQ